MPPPSKPANLSKEDMKPLRLPPPRPYEKSEKGYQKIPDEDQAALITYSDGCVMECYQRSQMRRLAAKRSRDLFVGNHCDCPRRDSARHAVQSGHQRAGVGGAAGLLFADQRDAHLSAGGQSHAGD